METSAATWRWDSTVSRRLAIGCASEVGSAVVGAWGAFGLIFTSIAVAHTLYAPREVVLWNWRRILLLGLSIAICVGAQFSFWIVLVPALLFMLWVGHVRRGAVVVIFATACIIALILLSAFYGFRIPTFAKALAHADWLEIASRDFFSAGMSWLLKTVFLENGLGLLILMLVTLVTFVVWKRTRFFGTAAPLIVSILLFSMGLRMHFSAFTFFLVALPFLILFMAGVSADLLESRHALLANAVVFGVLIANAMIDVYGLHEHQFPKPLKTLSHLTGWNKLRAYGKRRFSVRPGLNTKSVIQVDRDFSSWRWFGHSLPPRSLALIPPHVGWTLSQRDLPWRPPYAQHLAQRHLDSQLRLPLWIRPVLQQRL